MSYVELEPSKPTEAPLYHPGPRLLLKLRIFQNVLKHSLAEVAEDSLQVAVQEFKKIHEPKISKLKGRYLANASLIFNSWLKDIDLCVYDHDLTEHKPVQLVKDYMTEHANGAIDFYLNINDKLSSSKLIEHLRTSFESGETFNSLLSDFYMRFQKPKETENQFIDEMQVMARKVISVCSQWMS